MEGNKKNILTDGRHSDAIWKWMFGKKLNDKDKIEISALFSKYPDQMRELERERIESNGMATKSSTRTYGSRLARENNMRPAMNSYLERQGGSLRSNAPVSPGGFQKSGLDIDSAYRQSGRMTDQSSANTNVRFFKDGSASVGTGRRMTPTEVSRLISRGSSGASMSGNDQSVYDRYVQMREEMDRRRAIDGFNAANRREVDSVRERYGIPSDFDLTQDDITGLRTGKVRYGRSLRDVSDRVTDNYRLITLEEDAKDRENLRKERESKSRIAEKNAVEERDRMTRDAQSRIKQGTHEYTKEQRDELSRLEDEMYSAKFDKRLNDELRNTLVEELRNKRDYILQNPRIRIVPEKTIRERFNERTLTDDNGNVWVEDKNGKFSREYNSSAEAARIYPEDREYEKERIRIERKERADYEELRKEADEILKNSMDPEMTYKDAWKAAKERKAIRDGADEMPPPQIEASGGNMDWKELAATRNVAAKKGSSAAEGNDLIKAYGDEYGQGGSSNARYSEGEERFVKTGQTGPAEQDEQTKQTEQAENTLCPRCGKSYLDENGECFICDNAIQ